MAHEHAHAHSDVGGHASVDDQYRETPIGAGYEHTDANSWIIAKFLVWLLVAAVVIHFGVALLFNLLVEQRIERTDPRYPLAVREGERTPAQEVERIPEPRLQRFPREDFMNFRIGEENKLQRYGWVDKDAGTVHIPIHDAMRMMLERRMLQSRPPDPAAAQAPPPSAIPSDASAGRTLERRRQ